MEINKWVITLCLDDDESIEPRLAQAIEYGSAYYGGDVWFVSDVDATGIEGSKLTQLLNKTPFTYVTTSDLLNIIEEDGQIFDMEATLKKEDHAIFQAQVLDGHLIDVLGTGPLEPSPLLGKYKPNDVSLFVW